VAVSPDRLSSADMPTLGEEASPVRSDPGHVRWPEADVEIDEDLVRSLLAEQHPDLAGLPVTMLDVGWDNTLLRLGDEHLVRLPRRSSAAPLLVNEQRWLPELAPRLPLPVPAPRRVGRPSGRYPWSWSIVPWLAGSPADRSPLTDPDDAARRLGRFLAALHLQAPSDAPHNAYRGVALGRRHGDFTARVEALGTEIDVDGTRRIWDQALGATPRSGPRVWLHGDLHPGNLLVVDGTLAAVIDFGDLCAGDPATDLAAAWMLLPVQAVPVLATAYGRLDPALERRALGWAVLFALMLLAIGLEGRPRYEAVGRSTLSRAIEYAVHLGT
jgi:aminoglycoside phosphotransferase (APT) family kinase protein